MKRWGALLLVALALAAPQARAQDEEDETEAPAPPLPAGHPPVAGNAAQAGEPGRNLPQDTSMPDSTLPKGSVEAVIADAQDKPLPGLPVRLGILRQSVAEGEAKDFKVATTDADGKARFDGLAPGSKYSYRVVVPSDPAEYASEPFSLKESIGQRLRLHVFPVTRDIRRAAVGMTSVIAIEPKDDVFQFEMLLRVYNIGAVTWVPDNVVIDLPSGFKAFNMQESMEDTRVIAEGDRGVRLAGTFSPGQHEITFRFQVPSEHEPNAEFHLSVPPHLADVRIMSEAGRGMGLEVAGMSNGEPNVGEDGRRMLITGRRLKQGEAEMRDIAIRLTGIPTPGPGRWYAIGIAGLVALGGIAVARGSAKDPKAATLSAKDAARARSLLLDELVELEKARRADKIGPRTYESARRALFDALTRLEAQRPERSKKPAPRAQRARA